MCVNVLVCPDIDVSQYWLLLLYEWRYKQQLRNKAMCLLLVFNWTVLSELWWVFVSHKWRHVYRMYWVAIKRSLDK